MEQIVLRILCIDAGTLEMDDIVAVKEPGGQRGKGQQQLVVMGETWTVCSQAGGKRDAATARERREQ